MGDNQIIDNKVDDHFRTLLRENRKLKEELSKLDDYLLLLDNIDTHVFHLTDPSTYGTVNRAHAEFFGLNKKDLEHKNLLDVLPESEAKVCIESNEAIFTNKKQIVTEEILKRHDGEERFFSFNKTPKLDENGETLYVVCTGEDITDKKQAERLLTFTQFTIDQAEIAIFWCHADGHFFYVNQTACKWLQYSFAELKKMHVADINPQFPREAWREHWQDIKSKGVVHMESVHRRKNGEVYPVELYSNYVQFEGEEYKLSFVNDISDKVQSRRKLAESERFLENVIESIQDGMCVLDKELNIVHANRVMREWYPESDNLVGQKCFQAYHNRESSCKNCPTIRALQSGVTETEIKPGLPDISPEWLEISSYPIKKHDTGEVTGAVEFIRDISERLRLEKQLSQSQKMEAIGTLSGGIAHDFNNIMQAMLGSIQLLIKNTDTDNPDLKYLHLLENSVEKAKGLTSRLLYFSREVTSDLKPVNLNREMKSFVKLLERTLPKMISLKENYQDDLSHIRADVVQIEQVILNLAINASHAMPDGGKLLFETTNLEIDEAFVRPNPGFKTGNYVLLTVSDTGVGMDSETKAKIYDPFFTTKETDKGTGLGLSIVYGIVKNHDGMINCYSEKGLGTTFKIYFPAIEEEESQVQTYPEEEQLIGGKEKILIVDDEQLLLDLGREILEQFGYSTLCSQSGEEALAVLRERQNEIDLVILDLNMPGMGGYKTLTQMKTLKLPHKVIVASGYAESDDIIKDFGVNTRAFLGKPFNVKQLISTVRKVLDEV